MTRLAPLLLVLAGCWRATSEPPALAHHVAAEPEDFVMTARGVGPFNAGTEATEAALRKVLPKHLRVVTNDLGGESGVVFDVFEGAEHLFYVVPDDAPGWVDDGGVEHQYAGTTFAVFAVSPRIAVHGKSWRVGQPFADAAGVDTCECWGDGTVTACYPQRSHVRVIFEQPCTDSEANAEGMVGKKIDRIMWKRVIDDMQPTPDVPATP